VVDLAWGRATVPLLGRCGADYDQRFDGDEPMTTRRSVGGAARGPITPSAGSSPAVSIPYSDGTTIRVLRRMLSARDSTIDAGKKWSIWWKDTDRVYYQRQDIERRMIRERIKELGRGKK